VLLTHASNVVSGGFLSTTVYACLPLLKDSGVMSQRQITRMLTIGTGCFVVGKLSTAHIIELVGPKAAFTAVNVVGGLMCLMLASGVNANLAALWWCVYKVVGATSWPAIVQMLQSWATREDSVRAFSLYSTGSRTGAIAASLAVGLLVDSTAHGWRIALGGAGVAALAMFFACNALVQQHPGMHRSESHALADTAPTGASVGASSTKQATPLPLQTRLRACLRLLYDPLKARIKARARQLKERQALWRSRAAFKWQAPRLVSASPDDVVLLKPATLLRMFAGRLNFCARHLT
jgi:MFS family permease